MQTKRIKKVARLFVSVVFYEGLELYIMFSVSFLENMAGAGSVAAWSACFPEKKSNFLLCSQVAVFQNEGIGIV